MGNPFTRGMSWVLAAVCVLGAAWSAPAQSVDVVNSSFEEGKSAPEGWTAQGACTWLSEGADDGARAIASTGNGNDTTCWYSRPPAFHPTTVYHLRYRVKRLDGAGGTALAGPVFANVDLGPAEEKWQWHEMVFVSPENLDADRARLRFGQWHMNGTVAFDSITLSYAEPVHARTCGIVLGAGESITNGRYSFTAPLMGSGGNHSRPIAHHDCNFNSNRWVFGADSVVVYRHRVGLHAQEKAKVAVGVNYYVSGALAVEASVDGATWRELGRIGGMGDGTYEIPADLLPAVQVWVRLRAESKHRVGDQSDPGSFQVNTYQYKAALSGDAPDCQGATKYVVVASVDPRVRVAIQDLGQGVPGGENVVVAEVQQKPGESVSLEPAVTLDDDAAHAFDGKAERTAPNLYTVRVPYSVEQPGEHTLSLKLGADSTYEAKTTFHVPTLFASGYGELLPGGKRDVALWWASSGWKVSRTRPAPEAEGEALTIRAARNEAEAAQLVVRPEKDLAGLTIAVSDLKGPKGSVLPAACIDVLRVRYLHVGTPTDGTGVVGLWPDPLPPLEEAVDVKANTNLPLWIRVRVPRDAKPGVYEGDVTLRAEVFKTRTPLHVEVYGFELPDEMTCVTAFGFNPFRAFDYHRVTDEAEQRALLDKYFQSFAAHHISPYNPAPMDPLKVEWEGSQWSGGTRDADERHGGARSLLLEDASDTANVSATYRAAIAIPESGLRLRFWYKTKAKGQKVLVTLTHDDGNGMWMSGCNRDMTFTGSGTWQEFDQLITDFPEGARSVHLILRPALWSEAGATTGTVWYDDVSLAEAGSGNELIEDGGFEGMGLKPVFDWTAWDSAMERAMDVYHFNSFRFGIPGMGGGTFYSRSEPQLMGFGEDTSEYQQGFSTYCSEVESHLREKGWLDKAYVYWFDEPSPDDYAFVMNGFRKLKEHAPGLGRMLTEQIEPALIGGPNIWCPLTPHYDDKGAAERRKEGEKFWWYVCCGPKAPYATLFIDHPGTEMRVWLWQTWKRRIDGILIWETNYWWSPTAYPDAPQNPYEDPMSWRTGYGTPKGTKAPWGNGDGRFIYPPEAAATGRQAEKVMDGPVDSIRWEMLRDGIEDYEYHVLLERMLDAKGARLTEAKRAAFESLLDVPETITRDLTEFTFDPAPIEARRHELAEAIELLQAL